MVSLGDRWLPRAFLASMQVGAVYITSLAPYCELATWVHWAHTGAHGCPQGQTGVDEGNIGGVEPAGAIHRGLKHFGPPGAIGDPWVCKRGFAGALAERSLPG
jgi:hypothetical protein